MFSVFFFYSLSCQTNLVCTGYYPSARRKAVVYFCIVSMVMSSLIFIVSGDSSSSSIIIVSIVFSFFGVDSFTLKSMNGSFFCFVSFILSLETSVMVSVLLLSNRSSSMQIYSVPISLKGFFLSTISSLKSITSICFFSSVGALFALSNSCFNLAN